MDHLKRKLAIKLRNSELAEALVGAGLSTPAGIRAASKEELEAAVGKDGAKAVRAKFKAAKK